MRLTEKPDFIELHVWETIAFRGDSCEAKPDGGCARKLARVVPKAGFRSHCALDPCDNFIRAEVGGKGKVWGTDEEISALLGPIDTEEEAKLWIYVRGFDVIGDDSLRVARSGRGYSIRAAKTSGCPLAKRLYRFGLEPSGAIRDTSSRVLETFDGCL